MLLAGMCCQQRLQGWTQEGMEIPCNPQWSAQQEPCMSHDTLVGLTAGHTSAACHLSGLQQCSGATQAIPHTCRLDAIAQADTPS